MKRILIIFSLMVALRTMGAPISQEVAVGRALEWMQGNPVMGNAGCSVAAVESFPGIGTNYSVYVVQLSPRGYLILNSDDRLPLVVCFSAESGVDLSDVPDNAFRAMLLRHVERMEEELATPPSPKAAEAFGPLAVTELYGPFLETTWNQCNPYNKLCPDDPEGSDYYAQRAPVGCVPAAYAQILNFHRWPLYGEGSRSYTDSSGSITGEHSADFSDAYDWENMLPSYDPWNPNPEAAEDAVAELMYELGVAVGANYEHGGTSASTSTLGQRLGEYFFFESCEWKSSQAALIPPMEADLRAGFPCVVSIPGHAIVADGLMVDDGTTTYHINYGWGGSNNGWWAANSVPGGALQNGVTSLKPRLMAFPKTNTVVGVVGESVELQWVFPKRREAEVEELAIHRLEQQTGHWQSDASEIMAGVNSGWEVISGGDSGDCWFAGPNGPAALVLDEIFIPDASAELTFWLSCRLGTATFTVSASNDGGNSYTELFAKNDNYSLAWGQENVSFSAYAGQQIRLRFALSSGSYYPSTGGAWLDDLAVTAGDWLAWKPFAVDDTLEEVTPEPEGQPLHYTILTNLPAGLHTLAAALTDTNSDEHGLGPAFTLTVDDGDGMPSDWENLYGLDTGINDGSLDPDDDGYSNFEEYICGTVPNDPSSHFYLESGSGDYPVFYAMADRFYTVQYRTNLVAGSWGILVADLLGTNGVVNVSDYDSSTYATRFYRVWIQPAD